ncbi:MAG: Fur family transcriptional regulator [Lachnospirales bacterium]
MQESVEYMEQLDYVVNNLKSNNLKVTSQRISIYSYLINSKEHPTAEKVYTDLKPKNPNLSLGTVYKTLETLKSNQLILGFNVGESSSRYDGNIEPHVHFMCSECDNVFDIQANVQLDSKDLDGFEVTSLQGFIYGKCKHCSNN